MQIVDLIEQKKAKKHLTAEQWKYINNQFKKGKIKNSQIVALLVVCKINGLDRNERKILDRQSIPKVEQLLAGDDMDKIRSIFDLKLQGKIISDDSIEWLVSQFNKGNIPDEYMAAILMAIQLKGMTIQETCALTRATLHSGEVVDLSGISGIVDKHSTGGVGDKVSFPLIAVVAANGAFEPMLTIRSLGHTGGTVNKLESIPGIQSSLSLEKFKTLVKQNGLAMSNLPAAAIPADKKLLKLRQETGTVDSIHLKTASILSEKLAEGVKDGLVFDIKLGSGAFFKNMNSALQMAKTITCVSSNLGVKAAALITNMDQPLGEEAGNENEIKESINLLKGKGPQDTLKIVKELGAYMLQFARKAKNIEEGRSKIQKVINNGSALEKFRLLIKSQGGDQRVIDESEQPTHSKFHMEINSPVAGYICSMATDEIGNIVNFQLGTNVEEASDGKLIHSLGISIKKKTGDKVKKGETLAVIHLNDRLKFGRVKQRYINALKFSKVKPKTTPLIYKAIISIKGKKTTVKNYGKREI